MVVRKQKGRAVGATPFEINLKPPKINWNRLQNKQLRQYVYANKLASAFENQFGKQLRYASRAEIARFLIDLSN